jgi:hypothetical protein
MVVHPNAFGTYKHGTALKVHELQLELVLRSFDLDREPVGSAA